ncbi:hypothetical protein RUM43_001230 [Polyplax serrata]|uniref:CN hydrolase domain-containing protein n=1 Tax=Polyplax serrata TaxID=468196 RepID=A0AAN8SEI4_POLSC
MIVETDSGMLTKIVFSLLLSSFQFQTLHAQGTYIGAVVEYNPYQNANKNVMLEENLKNYEFFIEEAARKKANIVVFPEGGLKTDVLSVVPNPAEETVATCNKPDLSIIMSRISCAAQNNKIYVVINLPEMRSIEEADGVKKYKYNTNVVFDRNGAVVARYAKYNLFDEFNTNKPKEPELSFFTTDFGVTFGTFICFDILFQEPTLVLVNRYKITDFLFTSQWFSELPFLTALQAQRGWAEANDVNLLASGYNDPRRGSTGSGIFNGVEGSIVHYMSEKKGSKLFVAEIPKKSSINGLQKSTWRDSVLAKASNASQFNFVFDDFTLLSDEIELFNSEVITPEVDEHLEICSHKNFCCSFQVRVDQKSADVKNYNYRAVVFNGVRKFGLSATGGVQACGVILCTGPSIHNCTRRAAQMPDIYEFSYIKIEGNFKKRNALQIPTTLTTGATMDTLKPNRYEFVVKEEEDHKKVTMVLDWSVDNLQTFAIWGRDFTMDGKKPSLPVSSSVHLKLSIPLLVLVFWLTAAFGF